MNGIGNLNIKFSLILANLVFVSSLNFMLSCVEHEKSFITSGPGLLKIAIIILAFKKVALRESSNNTSI